MAAARCLSRLWREDQGRPAAVPAVRRAAGAGRGAAPRDGGRSTCRRRAGRCSWAAVCCRWPSCWPTVAMLRPSASGRRRRRRSSRRHPGPAPAAQPGQATPAVAPIPAGDSSVSRPRSRRHGRVRPRRLSTALDALPAGRRERTRMTWRRVEQPGPGAGRGSGGAADAIPYFERAIALNPSRWAPRFNLAHAYGQLRRLDPRGRDGVPGGRRALSGRLRHPLQPGAGAPQGGPGGVGGHRVRTGVQLAPGEASFRLSLGVELRRGWIAPPTPPRPTGSTLELAPDAADADKVKARCPGVDAAGQAAAGRIRRAGPPGSAARDAAADPDGGPGWTAAGADGQGRRRLRPSRSRAL